MIESVNVIISTIAQNEQKLWLHFLICRESYMKLISCPTNSCEYILALLMDTYTDVHPGQRWAVPQVLLCIICHLCSTCLSLIWKTELAKAEEGGCWRSL